MDNQRECLKCCKPLGEGQRCELDGVVWKSCPACSKREGIHIFKAFPDAFGTRRIKGAVRSQSWCRQCRSGSVSPLGAMELCTAQHDSLLGDPDRGHQWAPMGERFGPWRVHPALRAVWPPDRAGVGGLYGHINQHKSAPRPVILSGDLVVAGLDVLYAAAEHWRLVEAFPADVRPASYVIQRRCFESSAEETRFVLRGLDEATLERMWCARLHQIGVRAEAQVACETGTVHVMTPEVIYELTPALTHDNVMHALGQVQVNRESLGRKHKPVIAGVWDPSGESLRPWLNRLGVGLLAWGDGQTPDPWPAG